MNNDDAQKLIVIAAVITLGSTSAALIRKPTLEEVQKKKVEIKAHRVIAGGFFAMFFCSIIAEFDPKAGVGLAALIAGGAFFKYGLPVLDQGFITPKEKKEKEEQERSKKK